MSKMVSLVVFLAFGPGMIAFGIFTLFFPRRNPFIPRKWGGVFASDWFSRAYSLFMIAVGLMYIQVILDL